MHFRLHLKSAFWVLLKGHESCRREASVVGYHHGYKEGHFDAIFGEKEARDTRNVSEGLTFKHKV